MSKITIASIIMLIISIFLNTLNMISNALEEESISLFQLLGVFLQIVIVVLLFI